MDACLGASGLNLTKRIQRNNTDPTIARRGLQNACQSGTEAQRIKNQARHVQEGLGNQRMTHRWRRNETSRLWLMQIESEWRLRGCSPEFPNAINASSCRLSGLNSRYVVMWLKKPELMRLETPSSFMSTHTLPCSWKDFMVVNRERRERDKESSESRALRCSQIWAGPDSLFQIERIVINAKSTIKRYCVGLQLSKQQFQAKCSRKFKSLKDNCLKDSSWKHSDFPLPTALFKPCFAQKMGSPPSNGECHSCLSKSPQYQWSFCPSLVRYTVVTCLSSQQACHHPVLSSSPRTPGIKLWKKWEVREVSFGHDFRSESLHHLWYARVHSWTKVCTLKIHPALKSMKPSPLPSTSSIKSARAFPTSKCLWSQTSSEARRAKVIKFNSNPKCSLIKPKINQDLNPPNKQLSFPELSILAEPGQSCVSVKNIGVPLPCSNIHHQVEPTCTQFGSKKNTC